MEQTNLDSGTACELLWVWMKKQSSRPLEIGAFGQMQLFNQHGIAFGQGVNTQTAALGSQLAKILNGQRVQICLGHIRHWHTVPVPPQLAEQKPVQRSATQLLLGASAAQMVFTPVADRAGIGVHHDFQPVQPSLRMQVDCHHNAQNVAHFVRNIDQQFGGPLHAHHFALVVFSDHQGAPFGIGKATNPLQVLVPPGLLPFDVLVFFHGQTGCFGFIGEGC